MAMAAMTLHPPNRLASTRSPHPPVVATSNDGVLPLDVLYEVMLRLPTEALFRFRAVCRSWRSLLCHPDFIAAAHNPGPLLAVAVEEHSSCNEVNVMDLQSGDFVDRVNVVPNKVSYAEVRNMNLDSVVCVVAQDDQVIRLIDLANHVVCLLPLRNYGITWGRPINWCMVGRAASTGEYKVLAFTKYEPQDCKILTLGSSDHSWKDIGHPPLKVVSHARSSAVVNGFAYFLSDYMESSHLHTNKIMVFDLNREKWLPATSCRAPLKHRCNSLAELNGHLVAGYIHRRTSFEMWCLVDLEPRSNWSRRQTITIPCCQDVFSQTCYVDFAKPLAVLDDGRIVMWMRVFGMTIEYDAVSIYDPRTKTFIDGTKLPNCSTVSVFVWRLLHSGQRSPIDVAAELLITGRGHRITEPCRRHSRSEAPSSIHDSEQLPELMDF